MRTRDDFNARFQVQVPMPVQWGDMDAFNHVNNAMYFRYFETARLAYFETVGMPMDLQENTIGPILAETSCRFRRALTYPDKIISGAYVSEIHEYGFMMQYGVFSEAQNTVAALGTGRVVMLDYAEGSKVEPHAELIEHIQKLDRIDIDRS
ncbi:acyl-CoA thioesterase [Marinicella sp. W31]|uniref:acyl-CoA thioesterase n=1 Tax=Marinicella sp. W31 TaxID=3023713 RepID=UPI003756ED54